VCPAFAEVHREQGNLRAAIAWALDGDAALDALALVGELGTYCWNTQLHEEADAWARRALDACGPEAPPLLRGRALLVRSQNRFGAPDRVALGLAAIEIFRALGDDQWAVRALLVVSNVRSYNGDFAGGRALAEEALETARRVGDDVLVGGALTQLALATPRAHEALPLVLEGAALLRAAGAHHFAAGMLTSVGMAALREDEYALAEEAQAAALDAARADGGDAYTFGMVSGNVGLAALLAGRIEHALAAFGDELANARAHGFPGFDFEGLLGVAAVAAARGEDRRAAILQAVAWRESTRVLGEAEAPVYERVVRRFIAPARERLGEAAWEAAGAEARAMPVSEAVTYALQSTLLPG
jgi:hypothetical protein